MRLFDKIGVNVFAKEIVSSKKMVIVLLALIVGCFLSACGESTEPTVVPSSNSGVVARELPTSTATLIPTETAIPPTNTPAPTNTPVPTETPVPTNTPTPTATPSPAEIVFQSNRDGDFEIYIMNVDGSNQRPLTNNNADDQYPRVSPDGRYITFQSERDGNMNVYIMNRDGSDQRQLTTDPAVDRLPTFSPDGTQILFASDRSGTADLYVVNTDGTGLQLVTDTTEREGHAGWSINDQLVFNGSEGAGSVWQIYTTAADGSGRRQLTNSSYDEWSPEWSPDGSHIVFLSERRSRLQPGIYLMNADGSNVQLVYDSPQYEWGPNWSGDGSQIIFSEDQPNGTADILIINRDGTGVRRLAERGSYPAWAVSLTP